MNWLVYAAAALPALVYLALNIARPAQYTYVLESGLTSLWPFLIGMAIVLAYAILSLLLLRSRRQLTLLMAILIAIPLLATSYAYCSAGRPILLPIVVSVMALAIFASRYVWASRLEFRRPELVIVCALAIFAVFAWAHIANPIAFSRSVGSFAIFAVFFGLVGFLALAASLHPKFGMTAIAAIILVFLLAPNNHSLPQKEGQSEAQEVSASLPAWVAERMDLAAYKSAGLPYPVVFVSAEGGGIYAAAHAYETLSILAQRCPTFTQHIFVAVGVSGGAFGNALFNASVADTQRPYAPCTPGELNIDASAVTADHLSPVLARFLLVETIDQLIPGQWLERDRASLLTESLRTASKDPGYLAQSVGGSWTVGSARPALAAVATKMSDGQRFVMSPIAPSWSATTAEWWPGGSISSPFDISLIEAAGISARFPWITPTGRLRVTETSDRRLADGGYFENSGAETVLDFINEIRVIAGQQERDAKRDPGYDACRLFVADNFRTKVSWQGCAVHVFPIHLAITSTSLDPEEDKSVLSSSFLLDPVTTLLSTRRSRGRLALQRASSELCGTSGGECVSRPDGSIGFLTSHISPDALNLPLGWYLSRDHVKQIEREAVPAQAFNYRAQGNDNRNDMSILAYHFDTSLYGDDATLKIDDLLGSP